MTLIGIILFFKDLAKSRIIIQFQVTVICRHGNTVLMSKKRPIKGDDLRSVLFILILFVSVVGGREFGNYFSSYENMTKLKVYFEVKEEEVSRYLLDTLD